MNDTEKRNEHMRERDLCGLLCVAVAAVCFLGAGKHWDEMDEITAGIHVEPWKLVLTSLHDFACKTPPLLCALTSPPCSVRSQCCWSVLWITAQPASGVTSDLAERSQVGLLHPAASIITFTSAIVFKLILLKFLSICFVVSQQWFKFDLIFFFFNACLLYYEDKGISVRCLVWTAEFRDE